MELTRRLSSGRYVGLARGSFGALDGPLTQIEKNGHV